MSWPRTLVTLVRMATSTLAWLSTMTVVATFRRSYSHDAETVALSLLQGSLTRLLRPWGDGRRRWAKAHAGEGHQKSSRMDDAWTTAIGRLAPTSHAARWGPVRGLPSFGGGASRGRGRAELDTAVGNFAAINDGRTILSTVPPYTITQRWVPSCVTFIHFFLLTPPPSNTYT
jgi:hypothetical protein